VDGIPWAIRSLGQYENYVQQNPQLVVSASWVSHHLVDALKATRDASSISAPTSGPG
jgi:hypothetical protein